VKPTKQYIHLIKGSLAAYSISKLEELLLDILAKEDYESAARVRDMIERRRK
jgi:protein-arginine kinase activator protein McsA